MGGAWDKFVADIKNPIEALKGNALDPLNSVSHALGLNSQADYLIAANYDPGAMIDMAKADWVAIKHWFPDLRRDRETQVQSASNARNIIYGRTRVGSHIAYAESTGDLDQTLHLICIHAGHEIDGCEEIYFDDKLVASAAGGWVINAPFTGKVEVERFDGSQTTACEKLVAASATNSGGWTEDHKLLGLAYTHITLTYDEGVFPAGLPSVKPVIRGKKVYDPRTRLIAWSSNPALCLRDYMLTDVDHGGMGCESDEVNDAFIIVMANICDQLVESNIPLDALFKPVTPGVKSLHKPDASSFEKRYTLNGNIVLDGTPAGIIRSMLSSCAGDAIYSEGVWKLFAGAPSASVATLDESWLNGGVSFQAGSNANDKNNTVKGTFTNSNDYWADTEFPEVPTGASTPPNDTYWNKVASPERYDTAATYAQNSYVTWSGKVYKAYSLITVPINTPPPNSTYWVLVELHDNSLQYPSGYTIQRGGTVYTSKSIVPISNTYLAEDGGEVLAANIVLPFTTGSSEAQRLAKISLEKSRRGFSITYPCNHKAFKLEIMDVVTVNNTLMGMSKLFRVAGWDFSLMGGTDLTLIEYDPDVYNWLPGDSTPLVSPVISNLPNPWAVAAPTGLSVSESLYAGNVQSLIMSKAVLSWVTGGASATVFDIYLDGVTYASHYTDTTIDMTDMTPGVHTFGVRASNTLGAYSDTTTLTYTLLGKSAPPPPVDSFLVSRQPDGTREFTWSLSSPPLDLAGYIIKYAAGSVAVWGRMSPLHSGLLPASPYESNQLPAGEYTLAIASVDTTGNESPPVYIQTTLDDPRMTNVWTTSDGSKSGWPGTLTDCIIDNNGWLEVGGTDTWDTLPATWDEWSRWNITPLPALVYENVVIDLGLITYTTPHVIALGIGGITNEMSVSDDNITWSAWGPMAYVRCRYIKIRTTVTGYDDVATLKILTVYLIVKPIIEEINDLDTATLTGAYRLGVGDIRLPIVASYDLIKQVSVSLQNIGPGWTWEIIDKDTAVGPHIKIYNQAQTLADCTIDAYIKGI